MHITKPLQDLGQNLHLIIADLDHLTLVDSNDTASAAFQQLWLEPLESNNFSLKVRRDRGGWPSPGDSPFLESPVLGNGDDYGHRLAISLQDSCLLLHRSPVHLDQVVRWRLL